MSIEIIYKKPIKTTIKQVNISQKSGDSQDDLSMVLVKCFTKNECTAYNLYTKDENSFSKGLFHLNREGILGLRDALNAIIEDNPALQ